MKKREGHWHDEVTREIARLGGQGILYPRDLPSLHAAVHKVFRLMADRQFQNTGVGCWCTRSEIEKAAGQLEGMRRMRDLRRWFHIDCERRNRDKREFVYRLRHRSVRLDGDNEPEQISIYHF